MADPINKTKKTLKQAIDKHMPIQFYYSSKKSKHFKGEENPTHLRTVQPVVYGIKMRGDGSVGYYVRAYILGHYSYSKNRAFTGDTNSNKNMEYWRLYNLERMSNVTLAKRFHHAYPFTLDKHPEYNPNDKWFDNISYRMKESLNGLPYISRNIIIESLEEVDDDDDVVCYIENDAGIVFTQKALSVMSEEQIKDFIDIALNTYITKVKEL